MLTISISWTAFAFVVGFLAGVVTMVALAVTFGKKTPKSP